VIRLSESAVDKFRNLEGWLKDINCTIGVKQDFPLSPTIFNMYIDKLDGCLKGIGCVGPTVDGIFIVLLYVGDIVLMVKIPYDLTKRQKNFEGFLL
jgi:hypothetical protein